MVGREVGARRHSSKEAKSLVEPSAWKRIDSLDPPELRSLVDQALVMVGREFSEILEPVLVSRFGHGWTSVLREELRRAYPDLRPARYDVLTYRRLLADPWDGRELLRDAFDRQRYSRSHKLLDGVRDVRNAHAHPDRPADAQSAESAVAVIASFASAADFDSAAAMMEMLSWIQALRAGAPVEPPGEGRIRELAELAERNAEQARLAEASRKAAEDRFADAADQLREAEKALTLAQYEVDRKAQEVARLKKRDDAGTKDQRRELARLQEREAAAVLNRQRAEAARDEAAAEGERLRALLDDALMRSSDLEAKVAELSLQLTRAQAAAEVVARDPGSAEQIRALRERVTTAWSSDPGEGHESDEDLPSPGDPWPYVRGEDVWTLSSGGRMTRRRDGTALEAVVGERAAAALIAQFLQIRPSGGRVWVDVDWDAATYVGDQLVYLGRLLVEDQARDEVSGIFDDLSPDDFAGIRSLQVRPGSFDDFVEDQVAALRIAYLSSDGEMNPVAVLGQGTSAWLHAPDEDETLGAYFARLETEARRIGATRFFISRKTHVGSAPVEHPDLPDVADAGMIREVLESGGLVEGVYYFAARRDGEEREYRHGIMKAHGNRLGEVVEGSPDQPMELLTGILG
ncbi:MAG TPA: hypothetical protein PLZ93_00685 [Nocardioides sp.]|uniref:hypothetical protein n=1 Tax=uncultured Nocardioides sp. TaxID=198441 RepID=UPI002611742B|nr:hypothetical protein [uncultured Nocardioides sp.]HRD59548.1 hypothetical protein [Nocardioides sp.]HRI94108.1 hypothetical protein [Nocardioides sp.]HRK44211.1 hypothetical protein [Nocardioides sp.]